MSYALAVDLGALRCGRVRRGQIINRRLRHYQVGRGIADEVLRDPFDSGAGGLAEIRGGALENRRTARTPAMTCVCTEVARTPLEPLAQPAQRHTRLGCGRLTRPAALLGTCRLVTEFISKEEPSWPAESPEQRSVPPARSFLAR